MKRASLMVMMLAVAAMLALPACSNEKAFNQPGTTGIGGGIGGMGGTGGGMGSGGSGY